MNYNMISILECISKHLMLSLVRKKKHCLLALNPEHKLLPSISDQSRGPTPPHLSNFHTLFPPLGLMQCWVPLNLQFSHNVFIVIVIVNVMMWPPRYDTNQIYGHVVISVKINEGMWLSLCHCMHPDRAFIVQILSAETSCMHHPTFTF